MTTRCPTLPARTHAGWADRMPRPDGVHWLVLTRTGRCVSRRFSLCVSEAARPAVIECRARPFAHFWIECRRFPSLHRSGLRSCALCGVVQPRDPRKIKPCRGVVRVALREASS